MSDDKTRIYPVREDIRFQNVFWTLERTAWLLLALVPLAALAGIFSNGPLSARTAQAENSSLSVQYERFQRKTVQARFTINIPAAQSDEIRIRLNPSFAKAYDIQSVQPQPAHSRSDSAGIDLFFVPGEEGGLAAVIWATPRKFGSVSLRAETDGGAVDIPVFIYP